MQVRTSLPKPIQKFLTVSAGELTLRMPAEASQFAAASSLIASALIGIESRAVIPREIEDILGITSTERRRWLEDGRLPSAGTRTVKLRGRGTITFHVFDPVLVANILRDEVVVEWRERDAAAAAERRAKASWKARKKANQNSDGAMPARGGSEAVDEEGPNLIGWEEFAKTGLP